MPTLATNKKVTHDYSILEKLEAGIVLTGPEVKAVKKGQINLVGSYISIDQQSEAWLIGAHISPYRPASSVQVNYDAAQRRKLLLSKTEIDFLLGKEKERGLTILPLSVYTKGSLIKVGVGICRGKRQFDKRESIKRRDVDREIGRVLRHKP